jgi:hypothetical protein
MSRCGFVMNLKIGTESGSDRVTLVGRLFFFQGFIVSIVDPVATAPGSNPISTFSGLGVKR